MNEQTIDALSKLNTDTYCADLASTAEYLARMGTTTAPSKVAAIADRIIAERSREAANVALRTQQAQQDGKE